MEDRSARRAKVAELHKQALTGVILPVLGSGKNAVEQKGKFHRVCEPSDGANKGTVS